MIATLLNYFDFIVPHASIQKKLHADMKKALVPARQNLRNGL
jgi:hypothetical protein